MTLNTGELIGYTWDALGLVWLCGYVFTKRTVRAQPAGARLFHVAILALGIVLMATHWLSFDWLYVRFIPDLYSTGVTGLALTVAGCAFAIWARITLGANWSGRATVKENHELITRGPYALTRHPIYTGLTTAILGSALAGGELRCIIGLAVILFGFLTKMAQEERLMMQTFPEAYPRYRQQVKALIPGVL